MSGWAVVFLILVLLPLGLLSVPLTFKAGGRLRPEECRLLGRISWGWGLLIAAVEIDGRKTSFGLRLAGLALPVPRRKPGTVGAAGKKAGKKAGRRQRSGFNLSVIKDVLNRQLLFVLLEYLKKLFESLRLQLRLSGVYGADDPALTGLLAGFTAALHVERCNLDLEADFSGPILDMTGEISARVVPLIILWLTIRLLLAAPVRKLWWARLKTKSRRKPKEGVQYV